MNISIRSKLIDGRVKTESCPSEKYAPDILGEIKDVLDDIEERGRFAA